MSETGSGGRLAGRVALITGTGGGQGRAAALRFAAEGAIVVGCGRKQAESEATVRMVEEKGGLMVASAPIDLSDWRQAQEWVESAAERYGRIDIVYNNASAARFGAFEEMSIADWHYTMDNDLNLVFYVTRFAWPYLAKRGGVVINASSGAAHGGSRAALMSSHCAAKGGVLGLTRQLAVEGAQLGIRVLALTPGVIETPATEQMLEDEALRALMLDGVPIRRPGRAEEIAAVAAFLASDDASYMTGSDTIVDGGMLARF